VRLVTLKDSTRRAVRNECVQRQDAQDVVEFARSRLGFEPDEKQCEVLRSTAKRGILNCTRQWGKTTVSAAKAVHRAVTQAGSTVVVASPGARQSGEWMQRAAEMVARLGIRPRGDGRNKISLALPNGSRIIGLPGQGASVRSFSALSMLVIDEAAWVPDEIYVALRPMLAVSDGDIWMMSTPNGKSGFFYETWQHGDEKWHRVRVQATDCARIPAEFLEEQMNATGQDLFAREHMCEFLGSGANAFDRELVEAALDDAVEPFRAEDLAVSPNWLSGRNDQTWYVGVDLGKKQDHSTMAIVGTCGDELHVHRVERIPLGTPYTRVVEMVRNLVMSPKLRARCTVVVDASGVGEPVVEMLRRADLGCGLTAVVITGGISGRASRGGGYSYVPKHNLMTLLQLALEREQLKIARRMAESGALVKELLSVRVNENGGLGAVGPGHDDLVMAVALACWRAKKGFNDRGSGGFL
jgi:phage FluMu gp28-like protein